MNDTNHNGQTVRSTLIATAVAAILLAGCAAAPVKPDGAMEARAKLTQLQKVDSKGDRPGEWHCCELSG